MPAQAMLAWLLSCLVFAPLSDLLLSAGMCWAGPAGHSIRTCAGLLSTWSLKVCADLVVEGWDMQEFEARLTRVEQHLQV